MKVAVIGASGQLGTDVVAAYGSAGHEVLPLTHADVRIEDPGSVGPILTAHRPDLVVNTAAMLDLEACERDPLRAFEVNAVGVAALARIAATLEARLVHISTDYVFDGRKGAPYVEGDATGPLNTYANSKLAGEHFVRALAPRHLVVRTCGLYGLSPCRAKGGLNFVELMLKLGTERGRVRVVDDERVTPTTTRDVAANLVALTDTDTSGVIHMTAQGSCTWFEFAARIFEIAGVEVTLERADPGEFGAAVERPGYSVLDNAALRAAGLDRMPDWADALGWYLHQRRADRRFRS